MRCFLSILWCFSVAAQPLQLEVKAAAAMLMNAETGAILYEKQGHTPVFPASTTKIATALFALDEKQLSPDQLLTVSEESLKMKPPNKEGPFPPHWWDAEGTRMWLCPGENLSVDALMHGMMLVSGNDAANVIAEGMCGSLSSFSEEINQYLKKIGCCNTKFLNPHGNHHPEHYTTVYDLCIIAKKALQIPKFREIVSALSYKKSKTNKQGPSELKQGNHLLMPGGRFYYPKAIGIKTGFHSAAQNTLVAAATDQGRTLIVALAGNAQREDRYFDAIRLFEAAFAEKEEVRFFFGRQHVFSRELPGAKTLLRAALPSDLSIAYYPSEEPECRAFIHWISPNFPIQKGDLVGEVRIVDQNGSILKSGDLFALEEVQETLFSRIKRGITQIFGCFCIH